MIGAILKHPLGRGEIPKYLHEAFEEWKKENSDRDMQPPDLVGMPRIATALRRLYFYLYTVPFACNRGEEADAVVKIGDCFLYGPNLRITFPAIVSSPEGKAHWVFFLVNAGSSRSYLSTQTSDPFGITPRYADFPAAVTIAGHHHIVYRAPQHSHFAEVDILGTHFLNAHRVGLISDCATHQAKLFFRDMPWKVMVEGAKL